jgi:uncharacterized delta-60 repeat protein
MPVSTGMRRLPLTVLAFFTLAAPVAAKPGDLDRGFGGGGRMVIPTSGHETIGSAVALTGSRILAVGVLPQVTTAQLTASGRIAAQSAFALPHVDLIDTGRLTLVRQPDGRIVMAGHTWGEVPPGHLSMWSSSLFAARLDPVARLDAGFGAGGARIVSVPDRYLEFADAGADATGRIVLAATCQTAGADSSVIVARLLANGSLDTSYGRAGFATVATGEHAGAVLVRRDGSAIVLSDTSRAVVVRGLDARGNVRPGFGTRLPVHRPTPYYDAGPFSLVAGPGSTVLVAGNDADRSRRWGWVARLRANGRLDRRFGQRGRLIPGGTSYGFHVNALARDHHGRILLAGNRVAPDRGLPQAAVARVTAAGRLDPRFGIVVKQLGLLPGVRLAASDARAVVADAHDRIVLVGAAYDNDVVIREDLGRAYFAVARLQG